MNKSKRHAMKWDLEAMDVVLFVLLALLVVLVDIVVFLMVTALRILVDGRARTPRHHFYQASPSRRCRSAVCVQI